MIKNEAKRALVYGMLSDEDHGPVEATASQRRIGQEQLPLELDRTVMRSRILGHESDDKPARSVRQPRIKQDSRFLKHSQICWM